MPFSVLNFPKKAHSGVKTIYLFIYLKKIFPKLFLFISLLCSAASITLCYQRASMEVVLPF